MKKIRWGILSTANIGVQKVIPAMQQGTYCEMVAIASRDLGKAQTAARRLNIPKAYGSYEELLADSEVDAVYNPMPNHLHVPWSIQAVETGKHVLCEKPIALSAEEAQELLQTAQKHPHLKIMEAFMYRHHPQWQKAKQLVDNGQIGELKTIQSFFSYHNVDPENVRNIAAIGGGGLMDIGCYCISLSRFIFGCEPERIISEMEYDPQFKTDRITTGIIEFNEGISTFTCSTQLTPYQRVNIFGTEGRIEIEIPFNAPTDKPTRIWHQYGDKFEEITFDRCDQYTIQGDIFSKAILNNTDVPTPLEDAVDNMRVIDVLIKSSKSNTWCNIV
jgi:predicted dehydrogenase